jgi:hypothetical protein
MPNPLPPPIDLGHAGFVEVVDTWTLADGAELRLLRYALHGEARRLLHWARGADYSPHQPGLDAGAWLAGVALEERESATARWQSIRRQELETDDLDRDTARRSGWEAGLAAHADKRARRRDRG